jgi:DNA-binding SARP family transcriptional activator
MLMTLNAIVTDIYQSFQEHAGDARVVLLHSSGRYRTALVSRLLSDPDLRVFYYAMGSDDVDIKAFLSGFTHDLAEQAPTFGANTNMVGMDHLADLTPLLNAFAEDLDQLSAEPYLLLLDEFDRATVGDDLQTFLEALIDLLPPQCRLVISSRSLPRLPWMALIAQRKAIMLRDTELIAGDFYQNQAPIDEARVRIQGLGPGSVILDNHSIDSWEGHLPRLLFFFALERPVVTRSEICQAFWPELSNDQAVNVFHVTKRRLHKALESLGVDVLIHEDGFYRVNPALSIHYDITDFVSALIAGRTATAENRTAAWQRVLDLYQRPFLQGHNETWIVRRRQEYQSGYLEALSEMATIRMDEDRPEHALALLLKATQENPRRQDLHRRVMTLYADLGRRSEAASHYKRLEEQLNDADLSLDEETRQLYRELMS